MLRPNFCLYAGFHKRLFSYFKLDKNIKNIIFEYKCEAAKLNKHYEKILFELKKNDTNKSGKHRVKFALDFSGDEKSRSYSKTLRIKILFFFLNKICL